MKTKMKNNKQNRPIALLVNDIHLNKDNGELVRDIFHQIENICEEYDISNILIGGDIFTSRSGQPLDCLITWNDIVKECFSKKLELFLIPGNHDKTNEDDYSSYLDVYSNPNIHLYRKAGLKIIDKDLVICFIPFFNDEKWMKEYSKLLDLIDSCETDGDINSNAKLILITHSGFDGVMNNDGSKVKSIIKPSLFKDFSKVLIGHYHNASKIANNVIYTGSAYQNNFGETITDKGFTLIYSDASIKHISSKFPKYIKEKVNVSDSESIRNIIEKYEGEKYDHIRIVFQGRKVDADKINVSELSKKGLDCRFESVEEDDAVDSALSKDALCYDKKSLFKDFIRFCASQKIGGEKMRYGVNLIKNL